MSSGVGVEEGPLGWAWVSQCRVRGVAVGSERPQHSLSAASATLATASVSTSRVMRLGPTTACSPPPNTLPAHTQGGPPNSAAATTNLWEERIGRDVDKFVLMMMMMIVMI